MNPGCAPPSLYAKRNVEAKSCRGEECRGAEDGGEAARIAPWRSENPTGLLFDRTNWRDNGRGSGDHPPCVL